MYSIGLLKKIDNDALKVFDSFFTEIEKTLGLEVVVLYTLTDALFHNTLFCRKTIIESDESIDDDAEELKIIKDVSVPYGNSYHNYGLAVAVNLIDHENEIRYGKNTPHKEWLSTGIIDIANKYNIKWNGFARDVRNCDKKKKKEVRNKTSFSLPLRSLESLFQKYKYRRKKNSSFDL